MNIFSRITKYNQKYISKNSGMTLIELLVVLGIFMAISGLAIFDYGSFKSAASIQNLSDDIALSIRKAQTYATGVRGVEASFASGFGVHFTTNPSQANSLSGSNKSFVVFADVSADKTYNYLTMTSGVCGSPTSANECLEMLNITSTDKIKSIWIDGSEQPDINNSIDIVFRRPKPDASFCYKSTPSSACKTDISSVDIMIANDTSGGKTRKISISNLGQINN